LLVDIELGRHMRGVILACRRLEWAKMRAIDLIALHEADMLQAGRDRLYGAHRVDEHRKVGFDEFRPAGPVLIGSIEDMRHAGQLFESTLRGLRVEKVDRDVP